MLITIANEGMESVASPAIYVCLMKLSGALGDKKRFKEWGFKAILSCVDSIEFEGKRFGREVEQWIEWVRAPEERFPQWGQYQ